MRSSPSTTTIRRSFWILLVVAFVVESGAAILAARSAYAQVVCHWSVLAINHRDIPACFHPAPLVGVHTWIPAAAVTLVILASLVFAIRELLHQHQDVHDRRADLDRCQPPTPAALAKVARDGTGHVRVVGSERAICYTIGYIRPETIVSTRTTEILTSDQLQAALAHEASHRRRRDPLRFVIANVVARGLFFMPVLRDLAGSAYLATEVRADDGAAALYGAPCLLRAIAKVGAAMSEPTSGTSAMAATELLDERMVILLGGDPPRILLNRRRVVVSTVALLVVIGLALLVPNRTPAQRPQPVHSVSVAVHR